jgi:hypothetical protein
MGSKVVGVSASSSPTGKCSLFNTLCLKFYACLVALVGCCSGKKELWLGLNVPHTVHDIISLQNLAEVVVPKLTLELGTNSRISSCVERERERERATKVCQGFQIWTQLGLHVLLLLKIHLENSKYYCHCCSCWQSIN